MRVLRDSWNRLRWEAEAWADRERASFALWLPVFMASGILAYDALRFEPWPWAGATIAVPAIVLAILLRRFRLARLVLIPVAAVALGFASIQLEAALLPPPETTLPNHAVVVQGQVVAVELLPDSRRLTLRKATIDGTGPPLTRDIRLRMRANDFVSLVTGDIIRVRAIIRPPSPPSYPGAWDQQRDAFFSGIGGSGFALAPIEMVSRDPPTGWLLVMQRMREAVTARIMDVIPGPAGPISVAILVGAQTGIANADLQAFRDSGLAHILSVSGLHIAIVMGFVMATLRFGFALSERASLFWPTRQLASIGAVLAGGLYTVFTGTQVPMIRCFVSAALVTLALLSGRRAVSLRGLGLAAVAIMLIEPDAVSGASFQMSFFAVLALVSGFEALRPWMRRLEGETWPRRLGAHLVGLALTSLLAGAASTPFGVYHFGRTQVYFVVANMVAVPLTSFIVMPAAMLALLLMPFGLDWLPLVVLGLGNDAVLWIAYLVAGWPEATVLLPHLPPWGLVLLCLGMLWLGLWRGRIRLAGLVFLVAGTISPVIERPPDILLSADGRLVGMRTDHGVFVQTVQGGNKFTREAWLHLWAGRTASPFPVQNESAGGLIRCTKDFCRLQSHPGSATALLVRGPSKPGTCADIAVLVSAEPARGLCPRPYPPLVDRFTVWKEGATAIWLDQTPPRILTDRAARGVRPWVPPPPTPRAHPVPKLPLAEVDRGD